MQTYLHSIECNCFRFIFYFLYSLPYQLLKLSRSFVIRRSAINTYVPQTLHHTCPDYGDIVRYGHRLRNNLMFGLHFGICCLLYMKYQGIVDLTMNIV